MFAEEKGDCMFLKMIKIVGHSKNVWHNVIQRSQNSRENDKLRSATPDGLMD